MSCFFYIYVICVGLLLVICDISYSFHHITPNIGIAYVCCCSIIVFLVAIVQDICKEIGLYFRLLHESERGVFVVRASAQEPDQKASPIYSMYHMCS